MAFEVIDGGGQELVGFEQSDGNEPAMYEGTPWECLAWLESYFRIQRALIDGCAGGKKDAQMWRDLQDVYDRTVFTVTIEPMKMKAPYETRPENEYRVMRLKTGLDLFDAIIGESELVDGDN